MQHIIISQNLKKSYQLGKNRLKNDTLRDEIAAGFKKPYNFLINTMQGKTRQIAPAEDKNDEFWALKDVSFEVSEGEVVGIIGHNGAGKSTLLKILSRITEPTEGRVLLYGRVGSLLEVGIGFHPELTGRENIFLNGAILGMARKEILRKFDEIIAFAEIEKFLDTPVKRYSSGMYVRLAFAVAAHLETEILLVDEVLAVGDANFQKKCLGKMDDVSRQGRTILFVSHNMNAIQRLCPRSIYLEKGVVNEIGQTSDVIARYLSSGFFFSKPETWIDLSTSAHEGTLDAKFLRLQFSSGNNEFDHQLYSEGAFECLLEIQANSPRVVGSIAVIIYDQYGTKLVNADTMALGELVNLHTGVNRLLLKINELHLNPGIYVLGLWMANPPSEVIDQINSALKFEIIDVEVQRLGTRPRADGAVSCEFKLMVLE